MRYSVDPDGVRGAADAVGSVSGRLAGVTPERAFVPLGAAFRGSLTVAGLGELGRMWSDRMLAARVGVQDLGRGLELASAAYVLAEEVARRAVEVEGQ